MDIKNLPTELVPVEHLLPNRHNARIHSAAQISQIASAISEFGWTVPVLVDEKNVILAGHGRLLAAKQLKLPQVPAIRLTHLSEAQKRLLLLSDNKITGNSDFDYDALALELSALADDGLDIKLTGFSPQEFDDIMASRVPGSLDEIDTAAAPEPAAPDETADWEKIHLKVPPETKQVFDDLMSKIRGKPHEQLDAMLAAVDVLALEAVSRMRK